MAEWTTSMLTRALARLREGAPRYVDPQIVQHVVPGSGEAGPGLVPPDQDPGQVAENRPESTNRSPGRGRDEGLVFELCEAHRLHAGRIGLAARRVVR